MLVYANQIVLSGDGAEEAVLKAIGGWLKEQLGFGLHPEQLKAPGEYKGARGESWSCVKIFAADTQAPRLYSWVLTVSDETVYGRQWNTELGLKVSDNSIEFSCVLKTDERSALVSMPVMASKPRVVSYVVNNIRKSPNADFDDAFIGGSVKRTGESIDSYRGFLVEIERSERDYPIVLVSPCRDGRYLINANHLQDELIGLAQVVEADPEFDSYQMTEILGNQWSAWDGAVNIIHTPKPSGFVRGRYFLAEAIEGWGETQRSRVSKLLAWVTNDTNITQMRNRIRPEGVVQAAFRRRIVASQERASEMGPDELRKELTDAHSQIADQESYFNQLVGENNRLESDAANIRSELEDSKAELEKKDYSIQALKAQLESSGAKKSSSYDDQLIFELACRKDQPSPEECLAAIGALFGGNCVILETAKKSAQAANAFSNGRQLLDMLRRLVTEYRQSLIEGGDNKARLVFGKNEYAAKESDTVMKNKAMKRARTFDYRGEEIEMFRHLKIGAADDITRTIRVHFHWDANNNKIVIGYCGKHLPVSDH